MTESRSPQEMLYGYLREQKYCDVLIDRMAGYSFQEEIEALDKRVAPRHALADPLFDDSPAQAPLLVRLPAEQLQLIEQILAQAIDDAVNPSVQTRAICAFIFSPLDQATLSAYLTKSLGARVEGQGSIYFRYFDPRVTHHLPRVLTPEQLAGIFGGARHWAYIGHTGRLEVIDQPGAQRMPGALLFTAPQWQALARIEAFTAAARLLRQAGHVSEEENDREIDRHLLAAHAAGLLAIADQATYAACAVRFGDSFKSHAGLGECIATAIDNGIPLADVLEQQVGLSLHPVQTIEPRVTE